MGTRGINLEKIQMEENTRITAKTGGTINLPSLWGPHKLLDVTELIDEAFIYVHTMKEPSNIYHEYIKAIRTITRFQNEYDNLPSYIKEGNISNPSDYENYLLYDTLIGFSMPIIYNSVKHTINKEKPNFKKIVDTINKESLSEIVSTKAVISNADREVIETEPKKRDIQKLINRYRYLGVDYDENDLMDY